MYCSYDEIHVKLHLGAATSLKIFNIFNLVVFYKYASPISQQSVKLEWLVLHTTVAFV